jgi:cobaltochelatase CobS
MTTPNDKLDDEGRKKVRCYVCKDNAIGDKWYHRLDLHLKKKHDMNVSDYKELYPSKPVLSAHGKAAAMEVAAEAPDSLDPRVKELLLGDNGEEEAAPEVRDPKEGDSLHFGCAKLKLKKAAPEDRRHVPAFDEEFHISDALKNDLEALALAVNHSENVLIVGPAGCGKSSLVAFLAATLDQPLRRVNLHGDVRAADFVGEKTVDVDVATNQAVVRWNDGILVDALRKGHWLLLDELDAGPSHILFVLQAVLEHTRTLVLTQNGGEVVVAHPDFRLIATANTLGRGDETGLYTGTNVLNEAFLDRFGTVIQASYLELDTEAELLHKKSGIELEEAKKMAKLAKDVREAAAREQVFCTLSTRRLLVWASKAVAMGSVKRAADYALTNRLSKTDQTYIRGLVQRVWR